MGDRKIEWGVYDPNADLLESHRNLPHRDQAGALTFVTFRLADSMPKQVVAQWHSDIEQWLQQNKLSGKSVNEVLQSSQHRQNRETTATQIQTHEVAWALRRLSWCVSAEEA